MGVYSSLSLSYMVDEMIPRFTFQSNTMATKYSYDFLGTITSRTWCAEEGQYIEKIVGNVYDFTQQELLSMGIVLDETF